MLLFISAFIFFAQISFLWNWTEDFSINTADDAALPNFNSVNLLGTLGHRIGWLLMLEDLVLEGFYLLSIFSQWVWEFLSIQTVQTNWIVQSHHYPCLYP